MAKNNKNEDWVNDSIKNHLNSSFDKDNIVVSEDLIARTLKAIKESETKEAVKETEYRKIDEQKAVIKWRTLRPRTLIGAAAAVILLLISIPVLSGFPGSKSDMIRMENGKTGSSMQDNSIQITEHKADATMDGTEKSSDLRIAQKEESAKVESYVMDTMDGSIPFSQLYSIGHFTMDKVIIRNNDEVIETKEPVHTVNRLYQIFDEYTYLVSDNVQVEYDTEIDIISKEGYSYTILMGEGIWVKREYEEDYTYYVVEDANKAMTSDNGDNSSNDETMNEKDKDTSNLDDRNEEVLDSILPIEELQVRILESIESMDKK